ncbi:hypothetical protein B0H63DRAFT_451693 [Podospora didyma]|uniref:Amidase domain-containing protein n=1 Tax=Podospora didyma TaxID=330526 RepID=A0AAE0KJD0_9PEZI|nr:hypothetical protein B0H63DRAFT_451693 [Podospora didyma]
MCGDEGPDPADPITNTVPIGISFDFAEAYKHSTLAGVRFAVPRSTILDSIDDPEVLKHFDLTLEHLREKGATIVGNVQYPSRMWDFSRETLPFQSVSAEVPECRASRFVRALAGPPTDFEAVFASQFAKGPNISAVLNNNNCDAIIIPEGCRNPSDLGQSPVVCLPMGFFSSSTSEVLDEFGLKIKGPNIPYAMNPFQNYVETTY